MKKNFLYILIISVLFFGCNSKENEQKLIVLENKNLLLVEENSNLKHQISDLENKIFELEKSLESINSSITSAKKEISDYITKELYNDQLYETHDLQYTLDFKDGGFNTKVYKTPNLEEEIYVIQKNDIVDVSNIVHDKETKQTTIKVMINNKIVGFIKINRNP